jgi:hypothetical protein
MQEKLDFYIPVVSRENMISTSLFVTPAYNRDV